MPGSVTPLRLFVNIDHVATVRQARGGREPDPVRAAGLVERAGADGLTVHLREDRRHIQDDDVDRLMAAARLPVNLELAVDPAIVARACAWRPHHATLVPERRQEITTEGGLDVHGGGEPLATAIRRLREAEVPVSLFID